MSQPRPEIELDTLPNWVCMAEGEDGTKEAHLTTYINTDNGLSVGCSEHPFSGGCSIPGAALADLIAQEADKLANKRLADLKAIHEIQSQSGNWNYDAYMHGLMNGLEMGLATIEGRDPKFWEAPSEWLANIPTPTGLETEPLPASEQHTQESNKVVNQELDKGDRQRLHDELTKQSHLKSLRSQGLDSDAELDR